MSLTVNELGARQPRSQVFDYQWIKAIILFPFFYNRLGQKNPAER
jgi:hypothetical protein